MTPMSATLQNLMQLPLCARVARHRSWLALGVLLWMTAVAICWGALLNYEFRGEWPLEAASFHWPAGAQIRLAGDRPTILFFMHPKCPCTRASLAELERLWVL